MEGVAEKREQAPRVSFTFSLQLEEVRIGWGGLVLRSSSKEASVFRIVSRIETVLDEVVGFLINLFIYLFLAALGLRCCAWAFSTCGERGLLFVAVRSFSLRWLLFF